MDAFDRADAMVQLLAGLLGVAVLAYFAYRMLFGRKKSSSDRRKPGDDVAEGRESAAGDAVPPSLDAARARSPALSAPQKKTVSGFAKWWLIFWLVANIGGVLAPAGSLADSPVAGLAFMAMLLSAAVAVGYYLLLTRKPAGLYVILAANTLGAFLNGVAVPGYSILVTTGLIPAILTYFITRKQVPYPFGRSRGAAPDETGSPAGPEPVQTDDDGDARPAALPLSDPPGEPAAAPAALPAAAPRREAAPAGGRPRVALPVAIAGAVVLLICLIGAIALAGAARTRSNSPVAPAAIASREPTVAATRSSGKTATPGNTAPAVVSPAVRLETKAGPVLIERAELLERFPISCSTTNPACNAARDGYQLLVLWLRRPGGGKIGEISADLFGEVINYLPEGAHDAYVTTADGSEAGLAAVHLPEGEFVLIFGLPQGAPGSLKLTWPGNRQLDISGLVQAGAPQAAALADKNPPAAPTRASTKSPTATPTPRPPATATATAAPTRAAAGPVSLAEALARGLADIQILGMGGASGASIQIVARALGSGSVSIAVEPGTVLRSSVPGEQDMVVRRLLGLRQGEQRYLPAEVIFLLGSVAGPQTYVVDAYCLNFHKDNPGATTAFSVNADSPADPAVAAVLAAAGRVPAAMQDIAAIQAAVWTVTDHPTWQEMADRGYSPNRQTVAALLLSANLDQACAQLFGETCAAPDCPMNPTGLGGTTGGPCVSRLPGTTPLAATAGPTATVAPIAPLKPKLKALLESEWANQVAWSPDGRLLAVDAYHIAFYDARTLKRVRSIDSVQWANDIAFSPDSTRLAAASHDGIKVWNTANWDALLAIPGTGDAQHLGWSPDGALLAVSIQQAIKVIDLLTGEERFTFNAGSYGSNLAFTPDGRSLIGQGGGGLKLWDVATGQEVALPARLVKEGGSAALAFSPDGQLLATASSDKIIRLWQTQGWDYLRALSGHTGDINALAFSPDGRRLASGAADLTVRLWDVGTGQPLSVLTGHTDRVKAVAFSPDGSLLASGATDNAVRVWDLGAETASSAPVPKTRVAAPTPTAAPVASPTAVPPTAAPTARSAAPTRAAAQPKPAAPPVQAAACSDPRVRITYPANGAAISGVTNFLGTANLPDQAYYKFEYKPADSPTWQYLTRFDGKTVVNDKLMDFFTTTVAPGVYDFRLIAVDRSGNYPAPCEIRVTVQR